MRKPRVQLGLSVAVIVASTLVASAQHAQKPANIVFMLADNLGYGELGVMAAGYCAVHPRLASTHSPPKACACLTSTSRRSARLHGRRS